MAVLACILLASCVRYTHPNGTRYCGTHIPTGAMTVVFVRLENTLPPPGATAPPTSQLPAPAADRDYTGATYARTSANCDRGSVVTVTPTDAGRLTIAIRSSDGSVTGVAVQDLTAPVTIAAWQSGHYLGALTVAPPHHATATPSRS